MFIKLLAMCKNLLLLLIVGVSWCESIENTGEKNIEYLSVKNGNIPLFIKPAIKVIYFYQNYLGRIKGSYCPMYPSCSEYGRQVISQRSYLGILETFDRLHRCSHDLENYDLILINGEMRYLDEPYKD